MAVNTTSSYANKVRDMYNKVVETAFVPNIVATQMAEEKQHEMGVDSAQGDKVDFYINDLLNPNLDTLSETTDPTSTSLNDSIKQVELLEKGGLVTTTKKLDLSTFNNNGADVANLVGINAAESTDILAFTTANTQTGSEYVDFSEGSAKSAIDSSDPITGALFRKQIAKLRGRNADPKMRDGSYLAILHPDVAYDLTGDTASGGFIELGRYAVPDDLFLKNEVGKYANARIVTSTNATVEFHTGEPKQAATTASSGNAAGSLTLDITSATGITAGDYVAITHAASSDTYTYKVLSVSTNELTICSTTTRGALNKNGFVYRSAKGSGLVEAAVAGDVVVEAHPVYTSYFVGSQALAYAYATRPMIESFVPQTGMRRQTNVYWYAYHNFGELRAESMQKLYSGSTLNA